MSKPIGNPRLPLAKAELAIAYVLRYGVILCAVVIALGLSARLLHLVPVHERSSALVAQLKAADLTAEPAAVPRTPSELGTGLKAFDPDAIMSLGLLLLIALPIVRVGMTVVLFLIEGDFVYLGITLFVFAVLIAGITLGRGI
jgi:uncharacterized membrane protein